MTQLILNGICEGAAYGLIAVGFGLIFAVAGVFHIAHASICVLSAYVAYSFVHLLGCNIILACIAGVLFSAFIGGCIERFVYQPLRTQGAQGVVLLLSSLAVFFILSNLLSLFFGEEPRVLLTGTIPTWHIKSLVLTYPQLAQIIAMCLIGTLYALFIRHTQFGLLSSAVAQDPFLSNLLGIQTSRVRIGALVVGSALGGLGFTLIILDTGVDPHSGMHATIAATIACIIVGRNRLIAPLVAGLLLGVFQSTLLWLVPATWTSVFIYMLLVSLLLFKPDGLFGAKERI